MRWTPWLGIVGCGCGWLHQGIQVGAEGTSSGGDLPGGAELWSAAGVTGARPIALSAEGDAMCGWAGDVQAGDVLDVDGDGVVDLALHCAGTVRRPTPATTTPMSGTLPNSEELRVLMCDRIAEPRPSEPSDWLGGKFRFDL